MLHSARKEKLSISLERGELRMERNQVGGSKEGRDLRNAAPVLVLGLRNFSGTLPMQA